MNWLKRSVKLVIGIIVLILVVVVAFFAMRSSDLESGKLGQWRAASLERRTAAVRVLTGTDANSELMVACIDKIATLPDSGEMAIRDAASLCYTGIQLRENL